VLQPEGEQNFLDLALERAFGRQKQVLGKLLRNRRAALDRLTGDIVDEGAGESQRVDAKMRIEAPVLDRHHRLRVERRHLLKRQCFPAGGSTVGDD
jgi:hypothetical protein